MKQLEVSGLSASKIKKVKPSKGGDPEMLAKINSLLDDRVRPALAGDGGGV